MAPAGLRWWTEVTRACVDRIHSIIWVSVELRAGSVSALSDKTLDLQMQQFGIKVLHLSRSLVFSADLLDRPRHGRGPSGYVVVPDKPMLEVVQVFQRARTTSTFDPLLRNPGTFLQV